jgi:hypothetical protein
VTTVVTGEPQPFTYWIVEVPTPTPLTIPEEEPTVATEVLELVHDPTPPELANVDGIPVHKDVVPVIAPGPALTTKVAVAKQPAAVYVIVAVPTVVLAVTTPEASTDAIAGLLLDQVPPDVALLNVLVPLVQALNVPVIATGDGLTVTVTLALDVQPL